MFRSRTVVTHHVGTSFSRVIDDTDITSSVKATLASSLYADEDIVDNLLENAVSSIANRQRQMHSYGRNRYYYGLPSGEVYFNDEGRPQVQAVLDALEGVPVLIRYSYHGALNGIHYGWQQLIANHGYNPDTNRLENLSIAMGRPIFLEDMYLELPGHIPLSQYEEESLELWGRAPNSMPTPGRLDISFNPSAPRMIQGITSPRLRVVFGWHTLRFVWSTESIGRDVITDSFTIPVVNLNDNEEYFQTLYQAGTELKYWTYQRGSGLHPTLDSLFDEGKGNTEVFADFYPNVYFRLNKASEARDKSHPRYRTGRRLLKYTGIDYDQIHDAIHQNPDIRDVQSAFMKMAVPADTNDQDELRYLFEFFSKAEQSPQAFTQGTGLEGFLSRFSFRRGSSRHRNSQAIVIRDRAFEMALINKGITKTRKAGRIGTVGSCSMIKGVQASTSEINSFDSEGNQTSSTEFISTPFRAYRRQVTSNFYDEVLVLDLAMRYMVAGAHHTVMGDDGGELCLIPLDRAIVETIKFRNRERLLMRSMHLVFNTYIVTVQRVRWYQRGIFRAVLKIVGIVITVWSMGGLSAIGAALVGLGSLSVMALMKLIAMRIIHFAAAQAAFKLFVKTVGEEVAVLMAIAAAVYGISTKLTGTNTFIASAKDFVQAATGLASAISRVIQGNFANLQQEWSSLVRSMEEEQKLIDDSRSMLETSSILSPLVIFGETPQQFYQRTIHSGNIGVLVLDDVQHFVHRKLQLPTFASSVEGYSYAT